MGKPRPHRPVKLVVGMITADRGLFGPAEEAMVTRHGAVDLRTELFPFTHTNYYDEELGTPLWRRFLSFEQLADPAGLAQLKLGTNELEAGWSHRRADRLARRINLDPGYVTEAKLVLATTKDHAHRLYLSDGIYAELTLQFRDGEFQPLAWTYPDYREHEYLAFFEQVRRRYLQQRGES